MATACLIPETGRTTSVRSDVSSDMRRKSSFLANNKKLTGPGMTKKKRIILKLHVNWYIK